MKKAKKFHPASSHSKTERSAIEAPLRIAITGGTGFVGSHLARRLLRMGHSVVVIRREAKAGRWPEAQDGRGSESGAGAGGRGW